MFDKIYYLLYMYTTDNQFEFKGKYTTGMNIFYFYFKALLAETQSTYVYVHFVKS